ncbi:MAG TPA: acetate/propionate family kinase [Woeseiaceae bacterium]|nr:acetate/propionate family kinase [Woeseiaceae bacterium]
MDDARYLLILNSGSSSLKFGIFDWATGLRSRLRGAIRDVGASRSTFSTSDGAAEQICGFSDAADAVPVLLDRLATGVDDLALNSENLAATGHRVVHGGEYFSAPVRIDTAVLEKLKSLNHLAPLHNPPALAVIEAVAERFPKAPAVAAFDTAFFHDLPEAAHTYAIPSDWRAQYGIRRYGFHGLAHQVMWMHLAGETPRAPARVVSLHLGQGCSAAAFLNGRPVETSMGFTPLEGLIMGTRPGDLDAGVILHLARQGHDWSELEDALNRESGLLGLSGVSHDVRELLEIESKHDGARLALEAFCHRVHKYLGAYAAVLGGIDALLIGGGIGENSPDIRARICVALHWLGLELDPEANARCVGYAGCISTDSSAIEVRVIPVDEEPVIAAATWKLLRRGGAGLNRSGR